MMIYIYVYIVISRDYLRGRGFRDVWTSDATLECGGLETSELATQIVWGMVQRRLHSTQLWGAEVQRQTVLATHSIYYILTRKCEVYGLAVYYHRIVCFYVVH